MAIVKSKLIKQLKKSYPNFLIKDLDKRTFTMKTTKVTNMDRFVNINKKDNKILPQKINY